MKVAIRKDGHLHFCFVTLPVLLQHFADELLQMLAPESAFQYLALLVDHDSMWYAGHAELLGSSILPTL